MKTLTLLLTTVLILACQSADANAQGQIFDHVSQAPIATYQHQPVAQYGFAPATSGSYSYASSNRPPRPVTGYGRNAHREYTIRQAQRRWAQTGRQPQRRGNILWAR